MPTQKDFLIMHIYINIIQHLHMLYRDLLSLGSEFILISLHGIKTNW